MSKPRKKYQPRAIGIPHIFMREAVADVFPNKAFELHAAIVTMIERPDTDHCNNLTRQLCTIAGGLSYMRGGRMLRDERDAPAIAVNSAIRVIEDIIDRIERTHQFAVTDTEARTLRAAAGKLDEALNDMPVAAWRLAEQEIARRMPAMTRDMEVAA